MQIQVADLAKIYEANRGLAAASFEVARGESVAIIGHNGAGKSTLLKMLAGWIIPNQGSATFDGVPITDRLSLVKTIGFVPEVPNLFEHFSVEYNLRFFARLFGLPKKRVDQVIDDFELEPFRRKLVQTLSKGLKQRVSFGRSMLPDPSVLLLDEPTSGLDFDMTRDVYQNLKKLHQTGKTIIFTSHRPEEVKLLATRILGIHQGKLIFDGSTDDYFKSQVHERLYSL